MKSIKLLKNGVKVKITDKKGEEVPVEVKIIDWTNPKKNDYFLASQFWITGEMYKRRADLIGFVNGIPLVFIELKAVHKNLQTAFNDNIRDYKYAIPQVSGITALFSFPTVRTVKSEPSPLNGNIFQIGKRLTKKVKKVSLRWIRLSVALVNLNTCWISSKTSPSFRKPRRVNQTGR